MPRRTEPEPHCAKVGARLRELRIERGLSLSALADATGMSKGHLSSFERGLVALNAISLVVLARGLGLPPLYLLTFPHEDERAHIAELLRKLPDRDVLKIRQELTKEADRKSDR
ncbi:helix-turn-helix domain-containing protein [Polyangium mundeleinium]|uniref:Helix-turn-helix transcriptional regulator n=1 Tax=Polyangium mundeleinium TaxID=2995306 RepID=A0ABT5ESF0_9BACT|nr:helix-turn-helix transcriptional regulator [Polyangium mundeleinium]MDC0744414.1 helix-turn-helix transcriptional regulator [Polyangium mundeleinium]